MRLARLRLRIPALLTAAVLLGQTACSGHRAAVAPRPRSAWSAGTVGVVSAGFLPDATLAPPPAGGRIQGLVRGAGQGFLDGISIVGGLGNARFQCSSGEGCAAAAVILLAVVVSFGTVGAVVGGIHGALTAPEAEDARRIREEAREMLADLRIQENLAERIARRGADAAGDNALFVALGDRGPDGPGEAVDYRTLAGEGIDTVVEAAVLAIGFAGANARNAPLRLTMTVRIRLYRASDGAMAWESVFSPRSPGFTRRDWDADGSRLFREWLDRLSDDVGASVARRIESS